MERNHVTTVGVAVFQCCLCQEVAYFRTPRFSMSPQESLIVFCFESISKIILNFMFWWNLDSVRLPVAECIGSACILFRRVRKISKSLNYLLHVRPSSWNNLAPTGQIFMKFIMWVFFENLSRKCKVYLNLTRIAVILYEDQYTFFILSCSGLLRMRNVSDKSCRGNEKTHFIIFFFFFENRAVYEIIWKKKLYSRTCRTWQHGACVLHVIERRLQTHTRKW